MSDEAWHLVKNTPEGDRASSAPGKEPTPLTAEEVEQILHRVTSTKEKPKPKHTFEKGEHVRITGRPVHELHRRRRGHQPRPLDAEGHGHDLRALDAGRARVPAGPEALRKRSETWQRRSPGT